MLNPTTTDIEPGLAGRDGEACVVAGAYGFAADLALPERDALLDAGVVADHLSALVAVTGELDVRAAVLVRAKYRIGESLRVVYRLDLRSGEAITVTARVFPGEASVGVARRAAQAAGPHPVELADGSALRPVVHDREHNAVWWTFPHDRRLRRVGDLLRPGHDLARLAEAGGTWRASEVVEYAPERSVTLRATDSDGDDVAYVKAYAPGTVDVTALAGRYEFVASELRRSGDAVAVPAPIGWSCERDLLVLEAMTGERWADLDRERGDARAALFRLGAAIAQLHAIGARWLADGSPGSLDGFGEFGRLRMARVDHSAELVALARPDVTARVRRLRVALAAGPPAGDDRVLLHGDCHPKNALLDRDRVALVDLDQAGLGSAAADLGSLLARLHQDALIHGRSGATAEDAETLGRLALQGYAAVRPLPSDASLRWHTVAAMVAERAVRAVNRVNGPALERLDDLLALAEHVDRSGLPR